MLNKGICIFILLGTIGVSACQKQPVSEQVTESVESPLNPKDEESFESAIDIPVDLSEMEPIVVEIVDSRTMETVHIITPNEFRFEDNTEAYRVKLEQLARELARGNEDKAGYDKRMVLDRVDDRGDILKGSPLVLLKERRLVELILESSATGGTVELPIEIVESGYNPDDILYIEEALIASYTTYFNQADSGRNRNIELSALAINNVIVGSGDYFSFNTVVGPRSEENGYQPAPEIVNKELVMGIGGGICQTSSTMFNAVDKIPVKYVERHHHSLDIGYVPKGRDATVSYGGLDFRFQNTNDVPFIIKTVVADNFLTVEIRTANKFKDSLVR
ncbi:VanW family protein [Sporosarcina oncorhynchi]|uniref:VanW family protein n=1 Tax=Sporosarcina oncorhynchi TaxID=3056444 RepID=A0ABZ0L5Z3_9BACL|nr:VanW family protein [Sporosarcina sp. T2O-4]WOV87985.1 VanW family protein [Sporosarcina sp. T2O-4]